MTQKKYNEKIYILIELFIKKPYSWDDKKFKQEMVGFSKLIKAFPDFEFFYHLPEYTNKFNSFFGFQIPRVKQEMTAKYNKFILEKSNRPPEYILENNPVVEISIDKSNKSKQNILEFLKE